MSTLFRLIHPLPPDPHPRYDYYDLSTELRPAPYLSSAVGPLQGDPKLLSVSELRSVSWQRPQPPPVRSWPSSLSDPCSTEDGDDCSWTATMLACRDGPGYPGPSRLCAMLRRLVRTPRGHRSWSANSPARTSLRIKATAWMAEPGSSVAAQGSSKRRSGPRGRPGGALRPPL